MKRAIVERVGNAYHLFNNIGRVMTLQRVGSQGEILLGLGYDLHEEERVSPTVYMKLDKQGIVALRGILDCLVGPAPEVKSLEPGDTVLLPDGASGVVMPRRGDAEREQYRVITTSGEYKGREAVFSVFSLIRQEGQA